MFATRIPTKASVAIAYRNGDALSIVSSHQSIIFTGYLAASIPNHESLLTIHARAIAAPQLPFHQEETVLDSHEYLC